MPKHPFSHSHSRAAGTKASAEERIAALRETLERMQAIPIGVDGSKREPVGLSAWADPAVSQRKADAVPGWGLPAGLAGGALNELVAAYADRPAAFGFLLALTAQGQQARAGPAVLVAARRALAEHGTPYGHGLAQLGLAVDRLLLVETQSDKDALWAIEETLRSEARPAIVACALAGGADLTSSRRLNLAAELHHTPLALLSGAKATGTSAAATRWRIVAAPAVRDRHGALAGPRWRIALERCRLGSRRIDHQDSSHANSLMDRPGQWLIEWNHVTLRFHMVEELADRPSAQGTSYQGLECRGRDARGAEAAGATGLRLVG
ncbi:MAG TPA: ImuA protein [Hyphomicrobiaceae bacterium]|nr:ImuA protein [Hyphomicrobiaceae bacterium]